MNRLRVIHITQALGGVETSIRNIVENIDDSIIESLLITTAKKLKVYSSSGKDIEHYHIPFVRQINPVLDIYSFLKLLKLLKKLKPDIIHCHSSKAGFLGRLSGHLLGIRTVYSPRAFSFLSSEHHFVQHVFLLLERIAARWTTVLLACSESELALSKDKVGIDSSRCILWKNCISNDIFRNSRDQIASGSYICYVGRPSYQKNPRMFAAVLRELKRLGAPVKFILVGAGQYSPRLKILYKLIEKYDLADMVEIRGWVDHEETLRSIAQSLMVILTSRYEGLPCTVIEAMALGKAVVATNVYGIRDIIIHSKTGLLVPADDYKAMAAAILRIKNDDDLRKRLESGAREEYLRHYDTKQRIGDLERIYFSLYNKTKILHMTQSLGGVEIALRTIVENIDDTRLEMEVAAPQPMVVRSRSGREIPVHVLPFVRNINLMKDVQCLFASINLIRRLKPSIIHVHSSKAGLIGRVAGWILRVPTVFTPHGFSFLSTPSRAVRTIYFLVEKFAKPFTTLFLACSESELKIGREQVGFAPSKCVLWKNNIPENSMALSISSPYQFEYICTIGRPSYQKNTEMLVRCMKRIKKGGYRIKCILIGTGYHSPMKNIVSKQIQTEGVEDEFIIREWVSHAEALAILRGAVLFVLPSRYEGLPLSVIEAMALGKAVVATNVLGTRDIIIDGKTGILVPLNDDESMANAILRIKNENAFRKMLESNAREEYYKHYRTEEKIGDLERIYSSILTGAGPGKEGIHTCES